MKIKIRGKIMEVEVCNNLLSRAKGLMFRKKSKPLLFVFKNAGRRSIHSFFCQPFKAIWMRERKIVEEKNVRPFSLSVKPKKPFTHLIEIPLEDNNKNGLFRR
jgi:uncharacterized membrane protein (UPF0127 family)